MPLILAPEALEAPEEAHALSIIDEALVGLNQGFEEMQVANLPNKLALQASAHSVVMFDEEVAPDVSESEYMVHPGIIDA